ncbi:ROK family transcriptional regulator [Litchfieldia alkalitelluris]|uniref:ROK family transcriptional regulator n=1 Tax=Litchfieldia alkalitelluris TaxID=304268 RepID=UPI0009977344|nr:ROK family transcriptional regulator [Litchfieldia alkalitelluris]
MNHKGTAILREINQKNVLSFLRRHKTCSRMDLVKALGVSKNTISLIIDQLIKDRIVKDVGLEEQQGAGRPRKLITLDPNAYHSIGLSFNNKTCNYVVVNYFLDVIEKGEFFFSADLFSSMSQQITGLAKQLQDKYPGSIGLSISIPGLVDPETGVVHESTHLGWKNTNLKEILESVISMPVHVINNVKASALGSIEKMADSNLSSAFYIRIEDGVGGALIIDNKIYNGISWSAGEFGHISVDPNGPLCNCGQKGCIETLISFPVFKKTLEQMNQHYEELASHSCPSLIKDVLSQYGNYIGIGITHIIHLINPEAILIESPYNQVDSFRKATIDSINDRALKLPLYHTNIQFIEPSLSSAFGAGVYGVLKFEEV